MTTHKPSHQLRAEDVEREMQLCIEEAKKNPDPAKQKYFRELFGDKTPTPEEFIQKIVSLLKEEHELKS